jgi:valyl-tRNA synthetase
MSIPEKYLKPYNPKDTEGAIYDTWEKSGLFNPDKLPERHIEPFSIVLPPPNVTGTSKKIFRGTQTSNKSLRKI